MPYVNLVVLVGHIGKDAETRVINEKMSVTTFSVAVAKKIKKNGEYETKTNWFYIKAWNVQDWILKDLKAGALVIVRGEMDIEEYEDKSGKEVRKHYIVGTVDFLRGKLEKTSENYQPSKKDGPSNEEIKDQFNKAKNKKTKKTNNNVQEFDEEDVPF